MVDVVDKATRRRMMSGIRGRDTKPELLLRKALHHLGFRYRLHVKDLPGKPDIVLPRFHAVIFVHGCFWHGHNCRYFKWPSTRPEFWRNKVSTNSANDARSTGLLRASGWRVATVWECATRGKTTKVIALASEVGRWLLSDEPSGEYRE